MRIIRLLSAVWVGAFMLGPTLVEETRAEDEEPVYTIGDLIEDLEKEEKTTNIIEDVLVVTPEGVLIFNQDYEINRATMLTLIRYCGALGRPVLLAQALGSSESRWCKDGTGKVGLDVYRYTSSGSLYLAQQNKAIPCSTAGIPPTVYALACLN